MRAARRAHVDQIEPVVRDERRGRVEHQRDGEPGRGLVGQARLVSAMATISQRESRAKPGRWAERAEAPAPRTPTRTRRGEDIGGDDIAVAGRVGRRMPRPLLLGDARLAPSFTPGEAAFVRPAVDGFLAGRAPVERSWLHVGRSFSSASRRLWESRPTRLNGPSTAQQRELMSARLALVPCGRAGPGAVDTGRFGVASSQYSIMPPKGTEIAVTPSGPTVALAPPLKAT